MAGVGGEPTRRDSDPPTGPFATPPPPTSSPTAAEYPDGAQSPKRAPNRPKGGLVDGRPGRYGNPRASRAGELMTVVKWRHHRPRLVYYAVNHLPSRKSICRPPSCSADARSHRVRGGGGQGGGELSRGRELWGPFCHSAKA